MADVNILFQGYNSITQTYNAGGYGEDLGFTALSSSVGSVTVAVEGDVLVLGSAATASAGSVSVAEGAGISVSVSGVELTASAGGLNIWSNVDTSQTPNWSEISASQTPSWSAISTSQTPNWTDIAA